MTNQDERISAARHSFQAFDPETRRRCFEDFRQADWTREIWVSVIVEGVERDLQCCPLGYCLLRSGAVQAETMGEWIDRYGAERVDSAFGSPEDWNIGDYMVSWTERYYWNSVLVLTNGERGMVPKNGFLTPTVKDFELVLGPGAGRTAGAFYFQWEWNLISLNGIRKGGWTPEEMEQILLGGDDVSH